MWIPKSHMQPLIVKGQVRHGGGGGGRGGGG